MNIANRPDRGFALLEIMFVLGVLSFVALVATQIFVAVNQTTLKTVERQAAQMRFDQAVRRLRTDVWNASQCTLENTHELQIHSGDKSIAWTIGSTIRRQSGAESNTWEDLQSDLHLEVNGNVVTVVQDPVAGDSGGRVSLLDAAALLKGGGQ